MQQQRDDGKHSYGRAAHRKIYQWGILSTGQRQFQSEQLDTMKRLPRCLNTRNIVRLNLWTKKRTRANIASAKAPTNGERMSHTEPFGIRDWRVGIPPWRHGTEPQPLLWARSRTAFNRHVFAPNHRAHISCGFYFLLRLGKTYLFAVFHRVGHALPLTIGWVGKQKVNYTPVAHGD